MKKKDRGANNDKTGGPDSDNDKGGEGDKTRKKMHMLKNVLKSTTKNHKTLKRQSMPSNKMQ